MLQRFHHVADEAFGVDIGDARVGLARLDGVPDGMHQMGFAESDAAVDEERVVGRARVFSDLLCSGLGELVALADHEGLEGGVGVEARADHDAAGRFAETARGRG